MHVHLVDGTYELFRYHYAPNNRSPRRGAVRGALSSMLDLLSDGATHVGVATDHVIESFRNDLWPGYKDGSGIDEDLRSQFPWATLTDSPSSPRWMRLSLTCKSLVRWSISRPSRRTRAGKEGAMDTYSLLREIADSWVLLLMFAFFIGAALFAFWPSMKADRQNAADIPFRNETFDEESGDE